MTQNRDWGDHTPNDTKMLHLSPKNGMEANLSAYEMFDKVADKLSRIWLRCSAKLDDSRPLDRPSTHGCCWDFAQV